MVTYYGLAVLAWVIPIVAIFLCYSAIKETSKRKRLEESKESHISKRVNFSRSLVYWSSFLLLCAMLITFVLIFGAAMQINESIIDILWRYYLHVLLLTLATFGLVFIYSWKDIYKNFEERANIIFIIVGLLSVVPTTVMIAMTRVAIEEIYYLTTNSQQIKLSRFSETFSEKPLFLQITEVFTSFYYVLPLIIIIAGFICLIGTKKTEEKNRA